MSKLALPCVLWDQLETQQKNLQPGEHNVKAKKVGRYPKNLMKYKTTPGVENCMKLVQNSNPPLSQLRLLELNPMLSCKAIDKRSVTLLLPKGTTIEKEKVKMEQTSDQDCVFGLWSDWSVCENGEKNRMRNVYQEARGNGKACPKSYETTTCESESSNSIVSHTSNQKCLDGVGYDGCSNPVFKYRIFTPSCNFHDICWGQRPKYLGVSKLQCDYWFYGLMRNTCYGYWNRWYHFFDRWWCYLLASIYYNVVIFFSDGFDAERYVPWPSYLNRKLGGYYIGYSVPYGCDCNGISCDYR